MESRLSAIRRRVREHPVVVAIASLLTIGGTAIRWAKDVLDWISRWDTWNAHASQAIKQWSVAATRIPPGSSEACYLVVILLIALAATRRRPEQSPATAKAELPSNTHESPETEFAPPSPSRHEETRRVGFYERFMGPQLDKARAETVFNEQRRARAEAEAAEERLRQIRVAQATAARSSGIAYINCSSYVPVVFYLQDGYVRWSAGNDVLPQHIDGALIAAFRHRSGPDAVLVGHINYRRGERDTEIYNGMWLGENTNVAVVSVGDTAELLIAVSVTDSGVCAIVEDRRRSAGSDAITRTHLPDGEYSVRVELEIITDLDNAQSSITQAYNFKLKIDAKEEPSLIHLS